MLITTCNEMLNAVQQHLNEVDVLVMSAAPADFKPANFSAQKIKKHNAPAEIALVPTRDILSSLTRPEKKIVIVGFAAETESDPTALLELGRAKIARKGSDYLVLNTVGWTEGFATEENTVVVVDRAGAIVMEASGSKASVADRILDVLA